MSTQKVMDTMILIRVLEDMKFISLFHDWQSQQNYHLSIPDEVKIEFTDNSGDLANLIRNNIVFLLPKVSVKEKSKIKMVYRKLSSADCAIFYYGNLFKIKSKKYICLTDDNPLRKALKSNMIKVSGTKGIYKKLLKDSLYTKSKIDNHFRQFFNNPRVFPIENTNQ